MEISSSPNNNNKQSSIDLINSVKSKYILKCIFSYLDINKSLELVKYSKKFQKKLEIDIEYFKLISGRYIKNNNNGICKEYTLDEDKLVFEGEYSNGKRNGKGKEFGEYNEIIFEGEYLNGKRYKGVGYYRNKKIFELNKDEGKEYYNNGQIKFEGEYLNNKRYNGKLYDINGNIECEIKYGKGFGKDYYYNGILKYEGDYLNGKGKEYNEYGRLIFEGEYLNGKRNGKGKEYFCGELVFDGEYLYGK